MIFPGRTLSRTEPCPAAWWSLWWDTCTMTLGRCIATTWNCWKHSCRSGRTEWKYLTSKLRINTEHILLPFLFFSVYQNFEFFIHTCNTCIIVNLKCVVWRKVWSLLLHFIVFFFVYSIVYKHLKQPDETKKESCVGIQLMGVVLSAKFPPYAPTAPVDQEK